MTIKNALSKQKHTDGRKDDNINKLLHSFNILDL